MNYFAPQTAAERYAKGRPYFHPLVIERVKVYLQLVQPVDLALDVACGTGLSTMALKPVAQRIIGVDASAAMLAQALPDAQITCQLALAEQLPADDASCDLMTVSRQGIHWFNQAAFLDEAWRVLKPDAWLVVYDNFFTTHMIEDETFRQRKLDGYLQRYPPPPRNSYEMNDVQAAAHGFGLRHQEPYENQQRFTLDELVDYATTQSGVNAAVEVGAERIEDVRAWMSAQYVPFFAGRTHSTFLFRGVIFYLQKQN